MGMPSVGLGVPLVTTPISCSVAVGSIHAGSRGGRCRGRELQPDQLLAGPSRSDLLERRAAHEVDVLVELDDAAEARLERIGVAVELIAVERHARLEPQRVARAEAARA